MALERFTPPDFNVAGLNPRDMGSGAYFHIEDDFSLFSTEVVSVDHTRILDGNLYTSVVCLVCSQFKRTFKVGTSASIISKFAALILTVVVSANDLHESQ